MWNNLNKSKAICLMSALIILTASLKQKQLRNSIKKKRRVLWSRRRFLRRQSGNEFCLLLRELKVEDEISFKNFCGMGKVMFQELLSMVEPVLRKKDTVMREAIPPSTKLLATLRFLVSGERFTKLACGFRISGPAFSQFLPVCLEAIYAALQPSYLKVPSNAQEWGAIAEEFEEKWNFPNCIGAIDGKHIAIFPQKNYGRLYYNYNNFHSVIVVAIADANYNFIYVHVGISGMANAAVAFDETPFCHSIATNNDFPADKELPDMKIKTPFVFVSNDSFHISNRVVKPYAQPLETKRKVFNHRLHRAHQVIENAFGLLCNKFRVLQRDVHLSVEKVKLVVLASCALHNFINEKEDIKCDTIQSTPGARRQHSALSGLERSEDNNAMESDMAVRETLCEYFNTIEIAERHIKKENF